MTEQRAPRSFSGPALKTERHRGMPPLETHAPTTSFFEFWPAPLFYSVVAVYTAGLALRYGGYTTATVANPKFKNGGVVSESKAQILGQFEGEAKERLAPFFPVRRAGPAAQQAAAVLARLPEAGLTLPVVAKPDMGFKGAGVRVVECDAQLTDYLENFPEGADLLIQKLVPDEGEAGVFFIRPPGAHRGHIFSLTLKYFPFVVGDGQSTLRQLILRDHRARRCRRLYFERQAERLDDIVPEAQAVRLVFAGNHARGAIFRDGRALVTEAMTEAFNRVADGIPEFHFGRFDVRFRDIEALRRGEDFTILELNGGTAEATHIWDSRTSLWGAYRTLFEQARALWHIGWANRQRGYKPMSHGELWRAIWYELALTKRYPRTQ